MPFEPDDQRDARLRMKAERARELAERKRAIEEARQERLLLQLSAEFVCGADELAALLRVSRTAALQIAARPDFPRACSPTGDKVSVWRTVKVIDWIERQEVAE